MKIVLVPAQHDSTSQPPKPFQNDIHMAELKLLAPLIKLNLLPLKLADGRTLALLRGPGRVHT